MKFYMIKSKDGGTYLATRETVVDRIKAEYIRLMVEWLEPHEFETIVNKNRGYIADGKPYDAAHDFCDANVAMIDAFQNVMGREPHFCEDTPESEKRQQHDFDLMGDAWHRFE